MPALSAHLRALPDQELLALLERRPDAVQRGVDGFDRLADALVQPSSCLSALTGLDAGAVQILGLLVETGLAEHVLPELPALALERDEHHRHKDVYEHTLTVLEQAVDLEDRLGGAPDHPMTLLFPEGEYLKGLVVMRR